MSDKKQCHIPIGPQVSRRQLLQAGAAAGLSAVALADSWPRLAGAGETADSPRYGGVLTMWIGGDPPNFDVHQNSTYLIQHLTAACYHNLV